MAKILSTYRGFTATEIKSRAEIPASTDMTVNGNTVECSNIEISDVKNILGESTYNLSDLCTSSNINLWSNFSPVIRTTSGTTFNAQLVNSLPTSGYTLGSFAGYNHGAATPGWATGGKTEAETDVWVNSGSKATLVSDVILGEVDYSGAQGLVLLAVDSGGTIQAWSVVNISGYTNTADLTCESIDNITLQKQWTIKSYIVDTATIVQAEDIEPAIICRIPNVDDASVTIKVKESTYWYYDDTGTTSIPSPWTQNGSAGLNLSTGYFDIGMIATNNSYTNLYIYVNLFDWTDTLVGSGDIYNDTYISLDDITGNCYLDMNPIDSYGYKAVVYFQYTT